MSDSLDDILKNRKISLPPDAAAVRDYIKEKLNLEVSVQSTHRTVIIQTKGSAAAGHLRQYLHVIGRDCNIKDKKLFIRIE